MKKIISFLLITLFFAGCAERGYTTADVGSVLVTYDGVIRSTKTVSLADSGAGTILGAIVGAVIGHQIGKGSGKDVATAAGAVAGGAIGSKLNSATGQELLIDLDNGQTISTVIRVDNKNPFWFRAGDRVRVYVKGGKIVKLEPIFESE